MNIFWASIFFFCVGMGEYFIDQWERLVSMRLKILSTLCYSALNNLVDLLMYVFLFVILDQFLGDWKKGVHDYYKLAPLLLYTLGKVTGTTGATWIYSLKKKRLEREKATKMVAKAKKGRKKTKKEKAAEAAAGPAPEPLLDAVEVEDLKSEIKERAIQEVTDQVRETVKKAFNE